MAVLLQEKNSNIELSIIIANLGIIILNGISFYLW